MALRVGIIGGTGLYAMPDSEPIDIESPWGGVRLWRGRRGGKEVFFLPRHGPDHAHVPLRVPHAAHIHALRAARCDYTIGVNNVGSLRVDRKPGSWVIPEDFIDLHTHRPTWYADQPVHVDFTRPYCPMITGRLVAASGGKPGVYVGVDGPRFETRTEVRWMASLGGDVIGMTGVPETVLAHEAGLCYAALSFVGNMATGLGPRVSAQEIQRALGGRRGKILGILDATLRRLPAKKSCDCAAPTRSLVRSRRGR